MAMGDVTLDQILAAPMDPAALQRHMSAIGLIAPPPPPAPGPTAPLTPPASPKVATMTPPAFDSGHPSRPATTLAFDSGSPRVPETSTRAPAVPGPTPLRLAGADNHPHAAPFQPMPSDPNIATGAPAEVTPGAGEGTVPMQLKPLNFRERQNLPLGEPGTSTYYRSLIKRQEDQNAHPWGKRVFDSQGNEVPGEENHPGAIGKIGHVLAKIGNIAGDIVAPGTMALIPGTDLNKRGAYHEEERALGGEQARETAANMAKARQEHELNIERQAEERLRQGDERIKQGEERVEQGDRRTTLLENKPTPEGVQVMQDLMGRTNPDTGQNYTPAEAKVELEKEIAQAKHIVGNITDAEANERYRTIQANIKAGKAVSEDDKNYAYGFEKLKKLSPDFQVAAQQSNKDRDRLDRSYQLQAGLVEKKRGPIEALNQRVGRLRDTLAQGNPQADALIAPELLSIMSGGPGSGLRMNEAEIARIVGGRSAWETLKANMQHWATDPASARSITPDQQQQIQALVDAVGSKLEQKLLIAEEAQANMANANSVEEHRKIYTNMDRQFDDIDNPRLREEEENPTPGAGGGAAKPKAHNANTPKNNTNAPHILTPKEWLEQQKNKPAAAAPAPPA